MSFIMGLLFIFVHTHGAQVSNLICIYESNPYHVVMVRWSSIQRQVLSELVSIHHDKLSMLVLTHIMSLFNPACSTGTECSKSLDVVASCVVSYDD